MVSAFSNTDCNLSSVKKGKRKGKGSKTLPPTLPTTPTSAAMVKREAPAEGSPGSRHSSGETIR
jgi:hypothetical protein